MGQKHTEHKYIEVSHIFYRFWYSIIGAAVIIVIGLAVWVEDLWRPMLYVGGEFRKDADMRIYLDNCCYNRPFDDQSQLVVYLETQSKLFIQELIKRRSIDLAISFMSMFENSDNPFEEKKAHILGFYRYKSILIDESYLDEATEIAVRIVKTGIKPKDALHVACAILAGCDYFLTTDKRLLKCHSPDITILNPIDFVRLLGGAL
ncbi:hypothetical protein FACS1894187_09960 [Synergistales bacterium]|nr:hypothetical protein FACS1894187_09960 [Synergistales bacterium]